MSRQEKIKVFERSEIQLKNLLDIKEMVNGCRRCNDYIDKLHYQVLLRTCANEMRKGKRWI